ncbi:Outer-membrane lipoprotein carrier protein [Castellaniella defragrans]
MKTLSTGAGRAVRTGAERPGVRLLACLGGLLLALLMALLPRLSVAATAQAQLQSFVDKVHSATGQFQQDRSGDGAGAQRSQSGTFAFQRPGKFRWQVTKPYAQLIVSDGRHVYQYDPDLDQVTERNANQAVGASPAALLFGSGSLGDAFTVKDLPDRDGLQWLRATPRTADAGFAHVDIGFSGELPVRLELLDAFGQTTRIVLSQLKTNPTIAADQFQFTVPKGAALVKMNE